jgi:hypothetical protein
MADLDGEESEGQKIIEFERISRHYGSNLAYAKPGKGT